MVIQFLLLLVGLVLLIKGADWLVDGSSVLAKKLKISDLAIGLTIVAFGTSAPELIVNGFASYQNHHDIVFGNVIGSNIFNLFLILGIAGLITPLVVQSSTVWKEIPISFIAIIVIYILANDFFSHGTHILSRYEGVGLFILFVLFIYYVYRQLKEDPKETQIPAKGYSNLRIWGLILIGMAGLIGGGRLVVTSAIEIASSMGVSEKMIGLTILAAGTSLPELATSVVATIKKNSNIAVGNIIGSNIFNLFFILSISAMIRPLGYDVEFNEELYILSGGTIFLFLSMFIGKKKKLQRRQAFILLLTFVFYTVYLIYRET